MQPRTDTRAATRAHARRPPHRWRRQCLRPLASAARLQLQHQRRPRQPRARRTRRTDSANRLQPCRAAEANQAGEHAGWLLRQARCQAHNHRESRGRAEGLQRHAGRCGQAHGQGAETREQAGISSEGGQTGIEIQAHGQARDGGFRHEPRCVHTRLCSQGAQQTLSAAPATAPPGRSRGAVSTRCGRTPAVAPRLQRRQRRTRTRALQRRQ